MSRTTITRFSRIEPARRLSVARRDHRRCVCDGVAGTHLRGVCRTRRDDGIAIDCSPGGEVVSPGAMINLPAAGDLPAVVVICGNDGKWHVSAAVVKRTSPRLLAPPAKAMLLQK